MPDDFNQKQINHIFHYTSRGDNFKSILKDGFAPSYCTEVISGKEILIPMVSFCNISLNDVDRYMHYGPYGIGMSLDWAIKNHISPVVYIHEKTSFQTIVNDISFLKETYDSSCDNKRNQERNNILIELIQHMKNWKIKIKDKEIITYHEREWRYIPHLDINSRLLTKDDREFNDYKSKEIKKKPHFPKHKLLIESIEDLKYIILKEEKNREDVLKILYNKFSEEKVTKAILYGQLIILTKLQIVNDF